MGYFTRVTRFTPPAASKSPSRKYPNVRRSSENIRTTASTSSTKSPRPSFIVAFSAFGSTLGKKYDTGETRVAHPRTSSVTGSYFSWQ